MTLYLFFRIKYFQNSIIKSGITERRSTERNQDNQNTEKKNRQNIEIFRSFNGFCPCQGVPAAGLEPARYCYQWILSPPRLPFRQAGMISYNAPYSSTLSKILQAEFLAGSYQLYDLVPVHRNLTASYPLLNLSLILQYTSTCPDTGAAGSSSRLTT